MAFEECYYRSYTFGLALTLTVSNISITLLASCVNITGVLTAISLVIRLNTRT